MNLFVEAVYNGLSLLFSLDPEVYSAIYASIVSSSFAILIATIIAVPLGFLLGSYEFKGRKICFIITDTLLAFPTVALGLIVFMLLSRRGIFGQYELLFTINGIVIGLSLLALPIVVSNVARSVEAQDKNLHYTLKTLGAKKLQILKTSIWEARLHIISAIVLAFSRVISEVGIATLVGGNIKWHTRTITTAIALETNKGDYARSMALAVVLVTIALILNIFLSKLRDRLRV